MITDARHDSTANAFHTTVPCLVFAVVFMDYNFVHSTHKIVGISTLSRPDHSTAQTRELTRELACDTTSL